MSQGITSYIKKNIGIIFYVIFLLVIAVLDTHKNYRSHMLFYVFAIVSAFIMMVFKKYMVEQWLKLSIITIISIFSIFLFLSGARHHFETDMFFYDVIPGKSTTLVEQTTDIGNPELLDEIFYIYYFKDKDIICKDNNVVQNITRNLENTYSARSIYNYNLIIDESIPTNTNINEIIFPFPKYIDTHENIYVVDRGIADGRIICVPSGSILLFCSEDLYLGNSGISELNGEVLEPSNDAAISQIARYATKYNAEDSIIYTMRVQMMAVLIFGVIGLLVCISLWGELGGWMVSMLSIPVGVIVWTLSGIILVVARLPYSLVTQGAVILSALFVLSYRKREKLKNFKYSDLFIPIIILGLLLVYYSTTCYTTLSYDSIVKLQLGFMLALNNHPYLVLSEIATYGLIEPFIHSFGFMAGGDYLYVIYPMFYISAVGLIFGGLYKVYALKERTSKDTANIRYIILMSGLGVCLLLTNIDFRYGKYYVLSHIIMSVCFLIFVLFVLFYKAKMTAYPQWGLYLAAFAIIVTRTEGIIYILFLLTLLVGYIQDKEFIRTGCVMCMLCIVWTVVQLLLFNGYDGGGYFFTPQKGVVLILGSLMTIVYLLLFAKKKLRILTKTNYAVVYIICMLAVITVVSLRTWEMAAKNFDVYIGHLSSFIEETANSGYFWGFVILSIAFLFILNTESSNLSAGIILGYLNLVFFIFLFRKSYPMHAGYGDSGRRMLVHIMPTSIFLILANMINETGNDELINKKENENA